MTTTDFKNFPSLYVPPKKLRSFKKTFYENIINDYLQSRKEHPHPNILLIFECEPEEISTLYTTLEQQLQADLRLLYHEKVEQILRGKYLIPTILWTRQAPTEQAYPELAHEFYTVRVNYFRNRESFLEKEVTSHKLARK